MCVCVCVCVGGGGVRARARARVMSRLLIAGLKAPVTLVSFVLVVNVANN